MRSTSASRKPRCRAESSLTSAPLAFSHPAIERSPVLSTGAGGAEDEAAAPRQAQARTAATAPRMVPPFLERYFTGFGVYSSAILSSKKLVGLGAAMKRR